MAGRTFHVCIAAHVDVDITRRLYKGAIQIRVFDMIVPASVKVAGTAGFPGSRTNAAGYLIQIQLGVWLHSRKYLLVGACRIVTTKAVNISSFCKIIIIILPVVSGMTNGATSLVAFDAHSKVVDDVFLPQLHLLAPDDLILGPFPVRRLHEVRGFLVMTLQTFCRHILPCLER
jgi:hypothetical protein